MRLSGLIRLVSDLSEEDRDHMFALMLRYYEGVHRDTFDRDLAEKTWVITLVEVETHAIRGFSTLMLIDLRVSGRPIRALFSGDTIVDHRFWGSTALSQAWAQLAMEMIDGNQTHELYWYLIVKGYKTYRVLPVFFREFYPRFDKPTPADVAEVIDALGQYKFPDSYDSGAGIVRGAVDACRLREGVASITDRRLRDPHVRFFAERNPNHVQGDELCCLAALTRANLAAAAWSVLGRRAEASVSE